MDGDTTLKMSRRDFLSWLAASAALLVLPGCESGSPYASTTTVRPRRYPLGTGAYASVPGGYAFPDPPPPIVYRGATVNVTPEFVQSRQPVIVQAAYTPQPVPVRPGRVPQQPAPVAVRGGKVSAISRNTWATEAANTQKMKAMNGVSRVTIHHEGSAKPNNDTTPAQVAATLRLIQGQHKKRMGAGDIGYHFIIDRTGMIWQGRDWKYQGAHTSGANSNNLGVMLLGNFEIQQPSQAQLSSLNGLVASLVRKYGLNPAKDIYGHADFCNTACPGKNLKPQVAVLRRLRV